MQRERLARRRRAPPVVAQLGVQPADAVERVGDPYLVTGDAEELQGVLGVLERLTVPALPLERRWRARARCWRAEGAHRARRRAPGRARRCVSACSKPALRPVRAAEAEVGVRLAEPVVVPYGARRALPLRIGPRVPVAAAVQVLGDHPGDLPGMDAEPGRAGVARPSRRAPGARRRTRPSPRRRRPAAAGGARLGVGRGRGAAAVDPHGAPRTRCAGSGREAARRAARTARRVVAGGQLGRVQPDQVVHPVPARRVLLHEVRVARGRAAARVPGRRPAGEAGHRRQPDVGARREAEEPEEVAPPRCAGRGSDQASTARRLTATSPASSASSRPASSRMSATSAASGRSGAIAARAARMPSASGSPAQPVDDRRDRLRLGRDPVGAEVQGEQVERLGVGQHVQRQRPGAVRRDQRGQRRAGW